MATDLLFELKTLIDQEIPPYPDLNEVTSLLERFTRAVKEGGPEVRREVNDLEAYETIVKTWTLFCETGEPQVRDLSPESEQVRLSTLEALYSITAGYPDLMDPRGFVMITQAIDTRIPEPTQLMALRVIRNICTRSEQNRDILASFFEMIPPLVDILRKSSPSSEFVHEWCSAMKSLLLADDKRVAYNRSAERKRILHQHQALRYLSQFLNDFPDDSPALNAIVVLLGSMACRENYCISMEAGGVLPGIEHILSKKHSNPLLTKHTLSLLRFINVSPIVREKVCAYGLMKHVLKVAHLYRNGADMVEIAMSCCAFMTLRCPCHVAQFLTEDGVEKVMEIIKEHMDHLPVLKGACFVLRNVAVHGSKQGKKAILEADGENIIRQIEDKYPEIKYNYTKPVLRDIGAPVSPTSELGRAVSQALMDISIGKPRDDPDFNQPDEIRKDPFENECRGAEEQPKPVRMNESPGESEAEEGDEEEGAWSGHGSSHSSYSAEPQDGKNKSPRNSRSGSKAEDQLQPAPSKSPRNTINANQRNSEDMKRSLRNSTNTDKRNSEDTKMSIRNSANADQRKTDDTKMSVRNSANADQRKTDDTKMSVRNSANAEQRKTEDTKMSVRNSANAEQRKTEDTKMSLRNSANADQRKTEDTKKSPRNSQSGDNPNKSSKGVLGNGSQSGSSEVKKTAETNKSPRGSRSSKVEQEKNPQN